MPVNLAKPVAPTTTPMPRSLRRLLLSVAFLVVAASAYLFFGQYLALGLILAIIAGWVLAPLARKRGWGEGRLMRYLNRPPIADETKRAPQPTPNPPRARCD
jgi:hypothetical protein